MATTSYPCSETDDNTDHPQLALQPYSSNGFVDHWLGLTVEDAVSRGTLIRSKKPQAQSRRNVMEIGLISLATAEKRRSNRLRFKKPSSDPLTQTQSPARRCPLRIAELAMPTKRHCIETWRSKADTLPGFMVERLKAQILDQKPLAQIPDAINCFKLRKSTSSKRSCKKNYNLNDKKMTELRNICTIFGRGVAKKLMTQQPLMLSPELENISRIISNDITSILKSRFPCKCHDPSYMRIHKEISDKITIWIANIMEDSADKLLEEDLRVQNTIVRKMWKDDKMSTLIENHREYTELEEEGPVLNFVDDLVKNVMSACITTSTTGAYFCDDPYDFISETASRTNEYEEVSKYTDNSDYDTVDSMTNNTKSDLHVTAEAFELGKGLQRVDKSITADRTSEMEDEIKEYIDDILKKHESEQVNSTELTNESYVTEIENYNDDAEIAKESSNVELVNNGDYPEITNENDEMETTRIGDDEEKINKGDAEITNDGDEVKTGSFNDNAVKCKVDINNALQNTVNQENITDLYMVISEETYNENENNKTVKFSNITKVRMDERKIDPSNLSQRSSLQRVSSWKSSSKQDLVFAPPKQSLISDADELWPEHVNTSALRLSESVSQSITSLGRIWESEEKLSIIENENIQLEKEHSVFIEQAMTVTELEVSQNYNAVPKENITHSEIKGNENKISVINTTSKSKLPTKEIITERNKQQEPKLYSNGNYKQKTFRNADKGDYNNLQKEENIIYKAVAEKLTTLYETRERKFDYRVYPNTAPTWARTQSSEDSLLATCRTTNKKKITICDARKWCTELEHAYNNLKQWNDWLDYTCRQIICLKKTAGINRVTTEKRNREWIKLSRDIDKDAILWTKLNHHIQEKLKHYQRKHTKAKNSFLRDPIYYDNELIYNTVDEIDKICLWMHRMIVSTEYCVKKCDCKNNLNAITLQTVRN